jgi:hypothetical protein
MTEFGPPTGIIVTTKYRRTQFLFDLSTPKLVIDARGPTMVGWGSSFVPLEPGEHRVSCYFRWIYYRKAMESSTTIRVGPGEVIELRQTWVDHLFARNLVR